MHLRWRDADSLRRHAEAALADRPSPPDAGVSRDALVSELLVHQTELELQNEALMETQAELRATEEHFRELFENAPVGYLVIEGSGKIVQANARAAEILGRTREALAGAPLAKFVQENEAIPFEHHRREVLRTTGRLTAEFAFVSPEGRRREVRLESLCTNRANRQWRTTLTDVTAANAMARKLSHSERLGAAGRHATNIAHDVNNLLFSIAGHAEIALKSLKEDNAAYAPIVRLRTVAERCMAAIEQFSAFSRAEQGQAPIVDLNAELEGLTTTMRALLGPGIDLELGLTASDASVRMDPDQIEQIVLSAVRNAKQAMPHGGTFRIETASVELGGTTRLRGVISARCVRWTMTDTGLGMNESTRRRAFEPFFTTKAPGEGTGLGLSMISAVVDRAGGVVTLESQLGHGTSLIIHLPRATGFITSSPSEHASAEEPEPCRAVLLVEDDPEARVELALRLRSAGCDVVQAANGLEALELLRKLADRLNLVLVDENLPGASVEELLRAVRSLSEQVEVLITPLTSANGNDVDPQAVTGTVLRVLNAMRYANG